MSGNKLGFALVLLLLALVGGWFLSNYLTLLFLGLHDEPLAWNTWWQYLQAMELPQLAPFAGKIKLGGAVGFGLPLLVWAGLLIPVFRTRAESLHGDASFAKLSDLKKAGLLKQTPQGILVGKYKGRYLWLGGAQHVITISPTRSGKTTSVAIPVLLSYLQSIVVLDLKGELYKATSGWREAQGHAIRVWAPYDEAGNTHRFNPMTTLVGMAPGKRIGEIQTIAAILYPDEQGKDPFWTSQSRAAFTAFASYMFEAWDHDANQLKAIGTPASLAPDVNSSPHFPSFERILRLSSGTDGNSTKEMLQVILKEPRYAFVSPQTRTVFGNLSGLAEQTFSSVIATMQAPLQQFLSPVLAAATNATDIDIASLRKRPTTLYVIIPTNKLDESSKLLNIFFSTVIGGNLNKQLGEEPDLKYQMLMLMDEFTAMGRVDVWAKRISISASYGVRDLCIVQSRAQLRSAYGDNDAQNFITNHGAQIVFAPREQSDANEYSEMLGYKTLRKQHRSTSHGSGTRQVSINYTEEKRALFLPQEIKELPADDELIFYEGCKPIRAKKNWFFKDAALKKRASMPPANITLPKQKHPDMSNKPIRVIGASAALALAAMASPARAGDTPAPASSAPSAELIEQAREDGLTIEQEHYIQSLPKTPGYHWDGYSDKPVQATLGPNKFMFPMNLYFDQIGPDSRRSSTLGLYWPDLNPLPPGERHAGHYFEKYQNKLFDISVEYVDTVPIGTVLALLINEAPDSGYKPPENDPREHRSLRIKGDPVYGLVPYYTDMDKLARYFDQQGIPSDKKKLARVGNDWYLAHDAEGALSTVIVCTSREVPGAVLENGALVTPPPGIDQAICQHYFVVPEYKVSIQMSYLRAFLKDWKAAEDRIRALLDKYHVR